MHLAERELTVARDAIEVMANATTFPDFEKSWQDFLFRLERTWEIARHAVEVSGASGQSWLSANASLRRKDSLLRYLKHARDAETHAVEPTIENTLSISMSDALARPFRLDSVEVECKDGVLSIDFQTPDGHLDWRPEIQPGDPQLVRFKTRGTWYNPPIEHLGNVLVNIHPVAVAIMGHEFYKAAVSGLLCDMKRTRVTSG